MRRLLVWSAQISTLWTSTLPAQEINALMYSWLFGRMLELLQQKKKNFQCR